jgi:hypothetical protein
MITQLKKIYIHLENALKANRQSVRNRNTLSEYMNSEKLFLRHEVQQLLQCDEQWLFQTATEYKSCTEAWRLLSGLRSSSRQTDGIAKTLDVAEGFALWALVKHQRPRVVVELGTQYGISARVWKEALKRYVPEHKLILCDLEDKRKFIDDGESTLLLGDARDTFKEIFAQYQVDLLHNDAHPYDLVRWSVEEGIRHNIPIFTFHDVGGTQLRGGPFKPASAALSVEERRKHGENYGEFGHWERHVMAEIFDQRIVSQDFVMTPEWRMQIFDSLFGFGVAMRLPTKGIV